MIAILLSLGIALTAPAASEPSASANGATSTPSGLEVEVRTMKPRWAVSVTHEGPYWSIGKKFADVRAYMVKEGLEAPMYVRHSDEAGKVASGPMEIGVFVDGRRQVNKPFRVDYWPESQAVMTEVPSRRFNIHRVTAELRNWIEQSAYVAAGPLVEVYPATRVGGFAPTNVEVWMAIQEKPAEPEPTETARARKSTESAAKAPTQPSENAPPSSPPPSNHEAADATTGNEAEPSDRPAVAETDEGRELTEAELRRKIVERIEERLNEMQAAGESDSDDERHQPAKDETTEEASNSGNTDQVTQAPTEDETTAAPEASGTEPAESEPTALTIQPSSPAPSPANEPEGRKHAPVADNKEPTCPPLLPIEQWEPIGELIAAGEGEAVARQIVGCPGDRSDKLELWTAQFAIRIDTLVKAFERIYPSAAEPLRPVADALSARVGLAGPELRQRAINQLPAAVGTSATRVDDGRGALMRDIDKLLAELMTRRVEASAATDRFTGIMDRARRVLHSSGS